MIPERVPGEHLFVGQTELRELGFVALAQSRAHHSDGSELKWCLWCGWPDYTVKPCRDVKVELR